MGFVDKLRGELIDIVEWVDDSRHTLVWRFPRYHNQIKHGARLIVRPGQMAAFVDRGRVADVFGPGFHSLETRNLPILSTLQGWKHGFESPFKAEVYFASTRQVTDLKWGTPNPVIIRDPDFGPVRVRAFGTYTVQARDPGALLRELVGADSTFEVEEIGVLLRSLVNQSFADVIAASGMCVVDLASNYESLAEKLRQSVRKLVDDEYGLEIPTLTVVNISLPEEVEKALDARSSMQVVGDLGAYQRYQLAKSTPVAAENPAGGLASAGVGLGMGMAYATSMGLPAAGAGIGLVPPVPAGQPAIWHLVENGKAAGPLTLGQMSEAAAQGRLGPSTLVWRAGLDRWVRAADLEDLGHLFAPTPPPVPGESG